MEEALALLLQAEELDPEQSGITHAIADAYYGLNDYNNALFYAEYSLTKEPMNPWYRITLAQILYAQGYYQSAVKEIELVLSQHTISLDCSDFPSAYAPRNGLFSGCQRCDT